MGEERFGDDVVEDQHQDGAGHDRVGGGLAHPLGAALGVEAVVAAHQRDQVSEDRRLDEAGAHVHRLQVLEGVVDVGLRVEAELVDAHQVAAEDADDVGNQDQEGQHEKAGDQAGCDQVLVRIGRQRRERVDLLGDPHGADFRRHRGADPACDHQARQHRAQLAGDREHHDGRDRALGGKAGEPGVALQRQHHAGEEAGEPHHRERVEADLRKRLS